jgi:hypothetical protein
MKNRLHSYMRTKTSPVLNLLSKSAMKAAPIRGRMYLGNGVTSTIATCLKEPRDEDPASSKDC